MKLADFKDAMDTWRTPERIVFITSVDSDGKPAIITVGWKMRSSFNPPSFAIAVRQDSHMHHCIKTSREFVVAVPGADLSKESLVCGLRLKEGEDKFEKCSFETISGNYISSPLIRDCIANFECKVVGHLDSGDHTIFNGEVLASWVSAKNELKNLLVINSDKGYTLLAETESYKIGIIK